VISALELGIYTKLETAKKRHKKEVFNEMGKVFVTE
jgi:hypothetical protein